MIRPPHDPGGAGRDGALADLLAPIDGRAGPARRLSSAASADMVRAILDAALQAPAEPPLEVELDVEPPPVLAPVPTPLPVAPVRRPRWGGRLALAAAVLVAVSVASGASAVALRHFGIRLGGAELAPEPPPPPHRIVRRPAPPPPPRAEEVELPPEMIEAPRQEAEAPPPRRHVRRIVAAPPPPAPAPVQEPAPAPAVIVPENLPPADLLAFANERRARQQWREADVFYRATVSRFAGSDAASVAEVASAALHLQHLGDAAGALAGFERTLGARPSGPLAEEARWGVAEAHRSLGDRPAEARALRDFLYHHPDSALAPSARRRLSRLAP